MSDALEIGAARVQTLITLLGAIGNETVDDDERQGVADTRDYAEMVRVVERSIRLNVIAAGPRTREGYLRALADLLSMTADGRGPSEGWDPLANTAAAFPSSGA